jgi:AraC family transcriptional regulator
MNIKNVRINLCIFTKTLKTNIMKKINLSVITVLFLLVQSQVFGSNMQKSAISAGDTAKKCPEITIEVKEIEAVNVVAIKATVPTVEIGAKLGEIFPKLMQYIGDKGIKMAGPPYSKYYSWDPAGESEMEAGVPVTGEAEGEGEIEFIELPATKVATALHVGPYEKIGPVYEAIQKYIEKEGLKIAGAVWEAYLTSPEVETDPNKFQTQVYFPVE